MRSLHTHLEQIVGEVPNCRVLMGNRSHGTAVSRSDCREQLPGGLATTQG
jgi:hypothetical protein